MDTYLVMRLPDIWSPIYHPCDENNNLWSAYDFRWIRDLGTHIIKEITIHCGGFMIQRYSGEYLAAMVERDFSADKKALFNQMSGNVPEFYDLANAYGRLNAYPSAYFTGNTSVSAEPSFRSRTIYIPINTWFTMDSRCAFPLIALQYNELVINVTLRPIQELFQVRDVFDYGNNFPYIQPDFNQPQFQMYRFLQTPPGYDISPGSYGNTNQTWNADIHLLSTFCFLSEEERTQFAMEDQVYLIKDVFEYNFENVVGTSKVKLTSNGMISNWMWYMQRNDVNMRNEWSNYTNWPYRSLPYDINFAPNDKITLVNKTTGESVRIDGPIIQPSGVNTGYYTTGEYNAQNYREIMQNMAILLGGDYRETLLESGIYNYVEKYVRTSGFAQPGLYCYNFCINSDSREYQPSGAINMSKFKTVELEITTILPTVDSKNSVFNIICGTDGAPIGVSQQNWQMYEYTYNLRVFEERYNVLSFIGGSCAMLYAR
jgi:hypothetical protein